LNRQEFDNRSEDLHRFFYWTTSLHDNKGLRDKCVKFALEFKAEEKDIKRAMFESLITTKKQLAETDKLQKQAEEEARKAKEQQARAEGEASELRKQLAELQRQMAEKRCATGDNDLN